MIEVSLERQILPFVKSQDPEEIVNLKCCET